ncbi:MAG: DUF4125 family protein [Anaerovoracaceae bacterium]
MRDDMKRRATPKDDLINEIVEVEWEMFDKVNNAGGRAACQDDEWTFYAMRYSQFSAFTAEMLISYRQDLRLAGEEGRNLLMEKYAYMMEFTDPAYFDAALRSRLPVISPAKDDLVDRIANILIGCEQAFCIRYPGLGGRSRPVTGNDGADVSFHVYTIGELKTYSEETLELYYKHLKSLDLSKESENPSFAIHAMTAVFYGYKDLDDAEAAVIGV